jgi:hypothetical protein
VSGVGWRRRSADLDVRWMISTATRESLGRTRMPDREMLRGKGGMVDGGQG